MYVSRTEAREEGMGVRFWVEYAAVWARNNPVADPVLAFMAGFSLYACLRAQENYPIGRRHAMTDVFVRFRARSALGGRGASRAPRKGVAVGHTWSAGGRSSTHEGMTAPYPRDPHIN